MNYLLSTTLNQSSLALRTQAFRLAHFSAAGTKQLPKLLLASSSSTNKLPQLLSRLPKQNSQHFSTRPFDLNTNVAKDTILFKYDNPKYYKILNIFALCQFIFWTYLAHFSYTSLRDAPVEQIPDAERKWYQRFNLGENKYRNTLTIFSFLVGYGILAAVWMFTLRSVRFLVLRKGGREVSIVTYGPLNANRIMTVPLSNMSAMESREAANSQLPIKVKNRMLYYMLDMRGEFKNPQLFDYTAGLRRSLA